MAESDVGLQMVDKLFELLFIDEVWAVRRSRGFTWWSLGLAQHVEAGPMLVERGMPISRLRIWTEVINDVDPAADPARWLSLANGRQTLSALTWDPLQGTVAECCTAVIHEENLGWMSRLLSVAAVMQNTAAHSRARGLADLLRGKVAASSHPVSGQRSQPDDMLKAPEQLIATAGKESSRFVGPLTQGLQATLREQLYLGSAAEDCMTCEVPFTGSTPAMAEIGLGLEPHMPSETCLVQIFSDIEHPDFGHGALVTMRVPKIFPEEQAAAVANRLNLFEATTAMPTHLLGAWCVDPTAEVKTRIAFNAFLPNILAGKYLLDNMLLCQAVRSHYFGIHGAEHLSVFDDGNPDGEG